MDALERQAKIREASQLYYSTGTSPLTDAEFDALLEEERQENPNSPLLGVGHGFKISGEKITHKYGIVGSLPKAHNWGEYPKNLKGTKVGASLKLDGLSCAMYYRKGEMYLALTRGEGGIAGLDITDKIKKIVPDYVTLEDKEFTGAVRGEIIMSLAQYAKYAAVREDAKNPRNTTAGLISLKEISEDLSYLTVVVYRVIGLETLQVYPFPLYPFTDYESMHAWLITNFGSENVVDMDMFTFTDETDFMNMMVSLRDSWSSKFPSDGIVLTDNHITFTPNQNGISVDYNAVAFKFKAETKTTKIAGIEWNLSKTKYLVPTLLVEPVQLSGATVKRCAGCNAQMVIDNGWGAGAEVEMMRSGEVIPYIEKTITPATPELPTICPTCGTALIWEGVHLKCPNLDCKDIHIQDLLVWCDNIAPIDGLGDTLKLKFFEELHNNTIQDGFHKPFEISVEGIYAYNETIIAKGTQEKLFMQMLHGLHSNKVSIISALKALNIPRLGNATAELLSHYKEDIDTLISGGIPNNLAFKVGNANAESIITHRDKFQRLKYIYKNIQFTEELSTSPKIKVAITGSLTTMSRSQFEKILNANGFVLSDISKDTQYLITNTPDSGSSKNAKADKLGIEKITEAAFRAKFNL